MGGGAGVGGEARRSHGGEVNSGCDLSAQVVGGGLVCDSGIGFVLRTGRAACRTRSAGDSARDSFG